MRATLLVLVSLSVLAVAQAGTITGTTKLRGMPDQSNIILYAEKTPTGTASPPKEPAVMDQLNLTFVPHVLPAVVGTTVTFPNSDEVRHNVFSPSPAKPFNLGTYPRGTSKQVVFDKPGEVALLCNVHAEMSAYVLVLGTPYFTVTPRNGTYHLENLPPGKYTVTAWHERFKSVSLPVEIKGTETVPLDFSLTRRR